jgi:hypothetical protein
MGVLDEAIREHLELKRRHGADAGEVARLEHEALGPARREAAPIEAGAEPLVAEAVAADAEPVADDEAQVDPDAYDPTEEDEQVEALVEDEEPVYDEDLLGEEEAPAPPVTAHRPTEEGGLTDQPTVAFDVTRPDEHEGAEGPDDPEAREAGHDELEETPEFLQETPEHDRLWFEQKPPKDFDF